MSLRHAQQPRGRSISPQPDTSTPPAPGGAYQPLLRAFYLRKAVKAHLLSLLNCPEDVMNSEAASELWQGGRPGLVCSAKQLGAIRL